MKKWQYALVYAGFEITAAGFGLLVLASRNVLPSDGKASHDRTRLIGTAGMNLICLATGNFEGIKGLSLQQLKNMGWDGTFAVCPNDLYSRPIRDLFSTTP